MGGSPQADLVRKCRYGSPKRDFACTQFRKSVLQPIAYLVRYTTGMDLQNAILLVPSSENLICYLLLIS